MERIRWKLFSLACALIVAGPAAAQAPDCSGVSTVVAGSNTHLGELTTARIATGLSSPVHLTHAPGDVGRVFVVEQRGTIRIIQNNTLLPGNFLDIQTLVRNTGNEEGLLSMAFHPDYSRKGDANLGNFFVYYTNNSGNNQVSRFQVTVAPNVADPASETLVIAIPHPSFSNHNGGQIAFSPADEHLYVGIGDGGNSCDSPQAAAQNTNDLRGSLLRLNVDTVPYTTAGNPFDGATPGLDEIWSYGLRNPYRFSFDRITGSVYIGDVGQFVFEEVDCAPASSLGGENYGWVEREGNACSPDANPSCSANACIGVNPIHDYNQAGAPCAIIGGHVYRGCRMPDLAGVYFFGDHCASNWLQTFNTDASCAGPINNGVPPRNRTVDLNAPGAIINTVTSFGEDAEGEIYIVDRGGEIFKILPDLSLMEVSESPAPGFSLNNDADWSWENLQETSGHVVSNYKVYRSDTGPSGVFNCVHQSVTASWIGGDLSVPTTGDAFFYLATALNAQGEETLPGEQSDGTPRVVEVASSCP